MILKIQGIDILSIEKKVICLIIEIANESIYLFIGYKNRDSLFIL